MEAEGHRGALAHFEILLKLLLFTYSCFVSHFLHLANICKCNSEHCLSV